MSRIDVTCLSGPVTLTKQWAVDGTPTDVGDVTYTVVDGAGAELDAGTATKSGSGTSTTYTVQVANAALQDPGWLTVAWARTTGAALTDVVEVCGSQLFTEAEARATQVVSEAIAKGDVQAINYFVAQKYTEALAKIGSSNNNKIVLMPVEASSLIGSLGGIGAIAREVFGDAAPARPASSRPPRIGPES